MSDIEKTSPPLYKVESPLKIEKWNAAGDEVPAIAAAKQEALDAQEKLVKSLEQRYANPNWFKVAAGFLKPQLGGFGASLGSANEAFGEHIENQRAIAPTIERMRAEVAQGRIGMETNKEQSRLIDEYDAKGLNDTAKLRKILSLAPNSDVGQSIIKRLDLESGRRAETKFGVDLQKEVLQTPSLVVKDPSYGYINATPEEAAKYTERVNAGRPEGYTPQEWNAMKFPEREDAIAKYANEKSKQGMAEGTRFASDSGIAHDVLDDISGLRELATDPKLKPVFSLFQNGDLFSQIRAAAAEAGPGKAQSAVEALVAAKMAELKNVDQETRTKADKLIKDIATLEVRLRGSLNNPTDAASILSSQRSPTLANSQTGFVGILDQIAFNASRDIGIAKLHSQLRKQGLTSKDAAYTDAMENYRSETRDLRRQLAKSNYDINQTPSWYDTRNQNARAQPAAGPAAAKAATAAGGTSATRLPPPSGYEYADPTGNRIRPIPRNP
jgi:hypothetical protein